MPSADVVLVTGASGFVGSAVARLLAERGFVVRALVRASSPRGNLEGFDVSVVEGDMREPDDMRRAMRDVRYLFHVAADYRLWARDPGEIVRNNVRGTRAVMEAATETGVERVVYTSSVATLKPGTREDPSDEKRRLTEAQAIGAYKRSKVAAERVVEQMIAEKALPAVIVNPSTPIGPRDIKPTPTGRVIVEAATGRMPAFLDTGLNLAHVEDVAEGHLLALEKGQIGESYILGGQNVSLKEMLGTICELVGRRAPRVQLPPRPLFPLAAMAEAVAQLTGKEPFLTRDALRMAGHHMFFTAARAERELGYHARPYRIALEDALAWYRNAGYLR
jgi:dihydroflavonol-4-reductase